MEFEIEHSSMKDLVFYTMSTYDWEYLGFEGKELKRKLEIAQNACDIAVFKAKLEYETRHTNFTVSGTYENFEAIYVGHTKDTIDKDYITLKYNFYYKPTKNNYKTYVLMPKETYSDGLHNTENSMFKEYDFGAEEINCKVDPLLLEQPKQKKSKPDYSKNIGMFHSPYRESLDNDKESEETKEPVISIERRTPSSIKSKKNLAGGLSKYFKRF